MEHLGRSDIAAAEVSAEIQASNARIAAAIVAGDAVAIGSAYCEDAELRYNSLPAVTGREAITAFFLRLRAGGLVDIEFVTDKLRVYVDVAVETGSFRVTASGEGPVQDDHGRYTVVHHRAPDGAWQAVLDIPQSLPVASAC